MGVNRFDREASFTKRTAQGLEARWGKRPGTAENQHGRGRWVQVEDAKKKLWFWLEQGAGFCGTEFQWVKKRVRRRVFSSGDRRIFPWNAPAQPVR